MMPNTETTKFGLTESNLSLYANFFVQRAIGASTSCSASLALRALDHFKDQIFLDISDHQDEKKNIYLEKGNFKLFFDMKNALGVQQVAGDLKSVTISPIDSTGTEINVLKETDLKANQVGVNF